MCARAAAGTPGACRGGAGGRPPVPGIGPGLRDGTRAAGGPAGARTLLSRRAL